MSLVERFPYRDRNPSQPGFDLMPDLTIVLRSPPHTLSGLALVDSGSTISVLPYSMGAQLGFDWNSLGARTEIRSPGRESRSSWR